MDPSNQLFGHYPRYHKYPATHKEPELSPDWSKKQLEQQTHHCLLCSHCPDGAPAE
jgi:hypothetical protein